MSKKSKKWIILSLGIALIIFLGDIPQVLAQETATEEFTLEEIVVTAQKREENAQKIAIPMDVISGEKLAETGKMNVDDILSTLSNISVNYGAQGMRVAIRGFTEFDDNLGNVHMSTPFVAINLDGAYNSSDSAGQNLFDIERVEVLHGPQSTMYASNSPGGIVNVVTAAPKTERFEASGSLEAGNYGLFTGQAVFNAPLVTDKLAMRLAVQMQKRDSYVSGDRAGTEQIGEDTKSARLKTLYQPNDDFSITATINWSKKINAGFRGGTVQTFDTPDGYWYQAGMGMGAGYTNSGIKVTDPWTASFLGGGGPPGGPPGGVSYPAPPNAGSQNTKGIQGDIKWDTGIGTLSIAPHYTKTKSDDQSELYRYDTTGTIIIDQSTGYSKMDGTQKGLETRMTSPEDFFFKWILGVNYYKNESGRYTIYSNPTWTSGDNFYVREVSKAAFGNITYPFTDRLRGVGGIRFSKDDMFHTGGGFSGVPIPDYNKPDYKLGVEYDLAENSMIYANWATSYRINALRTGLPPEKDLTYTIGFKNRFLDNRLQLNGAAYWYDYRHVQFVVPGTSTSAGVWEDEVVDPDGNPVDLDNDGISGEHELIYDNSEVAGMGPQGQVTDVWDQMQTGAYRTIGTDLSLDWIITGRDRLNLSVTYLNSQWSDCVVKLYYQSASGGHFWDIDGMSFNGLPKYFSPKWTTNASYEHNFQLGAFGALVPRIELMYKTHFLMSFPYPATQFPVNYQEAYYTINGNATFTHASGKWTLNAYVKNATNYAAKLLLGMGGPGGGMTITNPRTFGAVLSVRF